MASYPNNGSEEHHKSLPTLLVVVPCFNEEEVLPVTAPIFQAEIKDLVEKRKISGLSRILFVDDGSTDNTWSIIAHLSSDDSFYTGIALSRNRGHQNALFAGLMEAKDHCDACISIDCDGQDDVRAMEDMVDAFLLGNEVVYGVRSDRTTDTFFKRKTAEGFYRFMSGMGVESVFNHADYRLLSNRVLQELSQYEEVNLFLRGMVPLVGFSSTSVFYSRKERIDGKSHYSVAKMIGLAVDGITSLSIRPIRLVAALGLIIAFLSLIGSAWAIGSSLFGATVSGWTSLMLAVFLMGGVSFFVLALLGSTSARAIWR